MSKLCRVLKVGGSLLAEPDLLALISNWESHEPDAFTVYILGGGETVNALRSQNLPDRTVHWQAISVMHANAVLFSNQAECLLIDSWDELVQCYRCTEKGKVVFSVLDWLRHDCEFVVPESWDVTSDSIAALLARQLSADTELVLLKRCDAPKGKLTRKQIGHCVEAELVDSYFAEATQGLANIRVQNLFEFRTMTMS